MDSDRVKGAIKKKTGELKENVGELTGDEKLKRSGQSDQIRGAVQNTVGGVKDALRESDNKSADKH
ncbi:MAG TPA: CsbD family protein [Steroidobacteraceae bacterium]|nr:CsbD family protein [Steroidobacteraceae bacterium]